MFRWARVLGASAANASADFKAMYTPLTWLFGWSSRVLFQMVFFALIGTLLGSVERQADLLVGAGIMAMVSEVMLVCASTSWERYAGTLPLLVVSPGNFFFVFVGRSLQWVVSGLITSLAALFALGLVMGLTWTPWTAALTAATMTIGCVSTYCFGLAVAAVVLNFTHLRNVIGAVATLGTTVISGALVPVSYWPEPVQWIAATLPVTHIVEPVRVLSSGLLSPGLLTDWLVTAGVGACWMAVASVLVKVVVEVGRRNGTLEFGE